MDTFVNDWQKNGKIVIFCHLVEFLQTSCGPFDGFMKWRPQFTVTLLFFVRVGVRYANDALRKKSLIIFKIKFKVFNFYFK